MRTIVYVDGYNLFYSLLTKSPYKWLDLYRLFVDHILRSASPDSRLVRVKYFTAPILGSLASDPRSEQRQAHYHRALRVGGQVEIIKGFHSKATTTGVLLDEPARGRVTVQVMEEKQTDVNIGLHMYRDAAQGACGQVVLCSNDADLEPVLAMLRHDFPALRVGVVLPRSASHGGARRATRLERHAHWTRHVIHREELAGSQFPDRIVDRRNRTIRRPEAWNPR
ncbi:NYN domain-containing protein [Endothiovibrio diazotrophicus]